MNAVFYHSNTGQSRAVAAHLAGKLNWPLLDISEWAGLRLERLVLVFPVHCQNIPGPVTDFLNTAQPDWLIPVATYGGMCHGNVLQQLQKRHNFQIPAAAYVPAKHSYLAEQAPVDYEKLDALLCKIEAPAQIRLPRAYKNPFSDVFPALRSRIGVKLLRTDKCTDCGLCGKNCLHRAINNGSVNGNCVRCLRCVAVCPVGGLEVRLRLPMRLYLAKKRQTEITVYT